MRTLVAAAVVVCAVLLPCAAASGKLIVGINDDVGYEASSPAFFMPTMQSEGLKTNALTIRWDENAATAIDPTLLSNLTTVIGQAQAAGVTVELDLYPLHSQVFTGGTRCTPVEEPRRLRQLAEARPVRRLGDDDRRDLPDGAPVHRHERVQPAALPEPAVELGRREPIRRDLRPRARGGLRRAQGRQQVELRLGRRPLAARQRLAERSEQLVDLAGALPAGDGGLVQGVRHRDPPHAAADGRARLPSLPGAAVAAVREGLCEPARREHLQPAADLPGVLRRLQRVAAADDRPAERRRAAAQPQRDGDPDERGRNARLPGDRGERELGRRDGRHDRERGLPGELLRADAEAARLRPERPRPEHLPPRRRAEPRRLAERALLVRRADAPGQAVGGSRQQLVRDDRRQLPGEARTVDARAASRAENEPRNKSLDRPNMCSLWYRTHVRQVDHPEDARARSTSRCWCGASPQSPRERTGRG